MTSFLVLWQLVVNMCWNWSTTPVVYIPYPNLDVRYVTTSYIFLWSREDRLQHSAHRRAWRMDRKVAISILHHLDGSWLGHGKEGGNFHIASLGWKLTWPDCLAAVKQNYCHQPAAYRRVHGSAPSTPELHLAGGRRAGRSGSYFPRRLQKGWKVIWKVWLKSNLKK